MDNTCIGLITLMGADAPIPPKYDKHRRPRRDAPAAVLVIKMLNPLAPPCLREALRRGTSHHNFLVTYLTHIKVDEPFLSAITLK
jgi:hypothetical protein